jgi:small subunit ribosomal protein S13
MSVRIAGVTIPNEKRVEVALTYIYGVGPYFSKKILEELKIDKNVRVKDLKDSDIKSLRDLIDKKFLTEGDLRREVSGNIKRIKEIGTRKGMCHNKKLPVRGQRTKTNSRTIRGGKKTSVGSGKSKAASQKT